VSFSNLFVNTIRFVQSLLSNKFVIKFIESSCYIRFDINKDLRNSCLLFFYALLQSQTLQFRTNLLILTSILDQKKSREIKELVTFCSKCSIIIEL
jgi:hypothetical protein